VSPSTPHPDTPRPDTPRLSAHRLVRRIGTKRTVDGIDVALHPGELVGVVGPNGAGKSTLLAMLAGLVPADEGHVELDGQPLPAVPDAERARRLAWLEQQATVHWPISVERVVALGRTPWLQPWQRPSAEDRERVEAALLATDCAGFRERTVSSLSGGERTRVLLARALAGEPRVLLADEPIAALDLAHQLQTLELLRGCADGGMCCAVVLHDLAYAARYCDRLYLLHEGRLHASGTPDRVLTEEAFADVYGVQVARGSRPVPWLAPLRRRADPPVA